MAEAAHAERVPRTTSFVPLVRAEIERLIGVGELVGGSRVNESALASLLGISRGPVREACRELVNTGLLQNEMNRGFFVREVTVKQALDIYDLRATLFGMAARLAASGAGKAWIDAMAGLVAGMDGAIGRNDVGAYYPLNVRFHQALMEAAGNYKLGQLWPLLEAELHLFRRRALVLEGAMRNSNEEHRAIVEALRTARRDLAGRLAERHIAAGKARFLLSLDGRAVGDRRSDNC